MQKFRAPQTGFDETDNRFAYRVMLRGPRDSDLEYRRGNRSGGYSQLPPPWKMAPRFSTAKPITPNRGNRQGRGD